MEKLKKGFTFIIYSNSSSKLQKIFLSITKIENYIEKINIYIEHGLFLKIGELLFLCFKNKFIAQL